MSKKVSLKFSSNGEEVMICYGDDKITDCYESKAEVIDAAENLFKKEKITREDFEQIFQELTAIESIPWNKKKSSGRRVPGHIGSLLGFLALLSVIDEINDDDNEPGEVRFTACKNCGKHGRIYLKNGKSNDLISKKQAYDWLTDYSEEAELTKEDCVKLKTEIAASSLPEEV